MFIPVPPQVNPSPVQPVLQTHEYDPSELVQVACSSQLSSPSSHSLMSEKKLLFFENINYNTFQLLNE